MLQFRQRRFGNADALLLECAFKRFDLFVQRLDMIEHVIDGMSDRIRHIRRQAISIEAQFAGNGLPARFLGLPIGTDHMSRNSDYRGPRRDVLQHNRVGTDTGAVADRYGTEYFRPGADYDAIAQGRVPFSLFPGCSPQRHSVIERAIIADHRGFAYDDTHAVIDEKTPPYLCSGMNLYTGPPASQSRNEASRPCQPAVPQPMAEAMSQNGVYPRVSGEDFKIGLGRGVAVEDAAEIFF